MSETSELKDYLVGSNKSFLRNDTNNGKTVMLSGSWGSGKTHFWINEIQPKLISSLKNKACVYVSLYGKEDIETIKNEILLKAYAEISKESNELQKKAIAAFGIGSKILSSVSYMGARIDSKNISSAISGFFKDKEMKKAVEYISDGGVICLDDFERKSKNINLNDLFGFISQLSLEMNCKVIIILNSDIFTGKEANTFKTVKEKSINKFFNFTPTIEELFESIFLSDEKYKSLKAHKSIILDAIKETKELNARLYIQVLDNCHEWIEKNYNKNALRGLSLCTINFIKNHFVFDTITIQSGHTTYKVLERFFDHNELGVFLTTKLDGMNQGSDQVFNLIGASINKHPSNNQGGLQKKSEDYHTRQNKVLNENKEVIKGFYHYKYILKLDENIDESTFEILNKFVYSGMLRKLNP